MSPDPSVDPVNIDVAGLVERSIASLHSYLVTRPTGRAVRLAIEGQFPAGGRVALSVVDLSRVVVLDFSCADEVVAKLILRYLPDPRPREAFFLFRGIHEAHLDPVEAVLERHGLAAVMQEEAGRFGLVGVRSPEEERVWQSVERAGRIHHGELREHLAASSDLGIVEELARRRLIMRQPDGGLYALSALARGILTG